MPPAMVPTACILCDSRSWASSSLRCASAFLRPVRSRANTVVVSPSAWRSNDTLTSTASSLPLAVKGAARRVAGTALEQRCRRRVEHGDALVLVHADDGVQRGVDDGLQPLLTGADLFVVLQRLALGQQWALVDHCTQKLRQGGATALRGLNVRDVQVARDGRICIDG